MKKQQNIIPAPFHGGDLRTASRLYDIPISDWLDLSTGINPQGYPVPGIPDEYFQRLPVAAEGFDQVVQDFYNAEYFAMASGSQQLLEILPRLRKHSRVAVPSVGYEEHAFQWRRHGHSLVYYDGFHPETLHLLIEQQAVDVAIVINPCNPTGATVAIEQLLSWHQALAQQGKWLIVDEAFIELTPEKSIASYAHLEGLLVLRSVGKFFGLAGIRVGFLLASEELTRQVLGALGCWPVSGPSQFIIEQALRDVPWHENARRQLSKNSMWLQTLLYERLGAYIQWQVNAGLFVSILLEKALAYELHTHLARAGILTRYWPITTGDEAQGVSLLRLGLIQEADLQGQQRLLEALKPFKSVLAV